MKFHTDFDQNSLRWMEIRAGKVTASEADSLVTPLFKQKTGEGPETYLCTKIVERWKGLNLHGFDSLDMEFGRLKEEKAIPFYELEFNEEVEKVAFIESDCGRFGCSPDGIIGREMGIEVKCLKAHNHVKILLSGEMPKEYAPQVQFSMMVTGWPAWRFLAFCPGYPPFVTLIERDEKAQSVINQSLDDFLKRFDAGWARLVEMNGGREPVRKPIQQTMPQVEPSIDIIP